MQIEDEFYIFTREEKRFFPPDSVFRVFLLQAPLGILGKKLGLNLDPNVVQINGFHTGVGFQSVDPQQPVEFYFDYSAVNFGVDVFLPKIVPNPVGGKTLIWNNDTFVGLGPQIDRAYWQTSNYVCNVSGQMLDEYQNWILSQWIVHNKYYAYARTILELTRPTLFNPLLRSSICDDFCYASFDFFQQRVCINFVTPSFITVAAVVVSNPNKITRLNDNNPIDHQLIVIYYEELTKLLEEKYGYFTKLEALQNEIALIPTASEKRLAQKQLRFDTVTPMFLLSQLNKFYFDYVILYTYPSTTNTGNTLEYFKIDFKQIYFNYIESNLKRTLTAVNLLGQPVRDVYTIPGVCNTSTQPELICNACGEGSGNWSWWTLIILMGILFLILIFIVIWYWVSRR